MTYPRITITLKQFLLADSCPPEWVPMDLYLVRHEAMVFYVGQSTNVHQRIWQHLINGYRARSMAGRFILCNWPRSLKFTIELMTSKDAAFTGVNFNLDAAERLLIAHFAPCLNIALNDAPMPLPAGYAPSNATIMAPRGPVGLVRDAQRLYRVENRPKLVFDV